LPVVAKPCETSAARVRALEIAPAQLRRSLLPRSDGLRYRQLTLVLGDDGEISLTDHQMGASLEAAWGGDDNEVSLTIPAEAAARLAFVLLAARLDGRTDAREQLAALCEQYGVDHTIACWT
jgi:hypothetical protein